MTNYYEFIGVAPTALESEITAAIDAQYNNWRRLVTHHDPDKVNQANQALTLLDRIRSTLTDSAKREIYDEGLGLKETVGGLLDPTAFPRGGPLNPMPAPVKATASKVAQSEVDAWVCEKCTMPNAIGTRFCAKCGEQLGINCPNCGALLRVSAIFCTKCGKSLEETEATLEWIRRTKKMASSLGRRSFVRCVIASGSFQEIYQICHQAVSTHKGFVYPTPYSVKDITTNTQNGEITGQVTGLLTGKICTIQLFLQTGSTEMHGVVFAIDVPGGLKSIAEEFWVAPFLRHLLSVNPSFREVK